MTKDKVTSKDRLILSGTILFAEKGFDGVSVREICKHAKTSMNMIHHYFENKEGLLSTILNKFTADAFVMPIKLLDKTPTSTEDFKSRLVLLFETTLDVVIENRLITTIAHRERRAMEALPIYMTKFSDFMNRSKKMGFVRDELDPDMIGGFILDRISAQVEYAPWIQKTYGLDLLNDSKYKERWCKSNIDLFLNGIITK